MGRKKKVKQEKEDTILEEEKEEKVFEIRTETEIMLKPKEWAVNEGLNPILFESFKDLEPVTKKEFDLIKQKVM